MSFVDYDNLLQTVAQWMARDDLLEDIADAVWMTECNLQREIQFDVAEKIHSSTTVANQGYVTLPDDFAEAMFFRWSGTTQRPPVRVVGWDTFDRIDRLNEASNTTSSQSRAGLVFANRLYITPSPGEFDFDLYYKAGVQHLGPGAQSNRILVEYPDALLYGSLTQMAPFVGDDERMQTWMPLYQSAAEQARQSEWRKRTGHGPLAMSPDMDVW